MELTPEEYRAYAEGYALKVTDDFNRSSTAQAHYAIVMGKFYGVKNEIKVSEIAMLMKPPGQVEEDEADRIRQKIQETKKRFKVE